MQHNTPVQQVANAVRELWRCPEDRPISAVLGELAAETGMPPGELAELGGAFEQIRADIAGVLRREAELQRLVQTARHLLASPNPEDLLSIVVEATRDLMRSDVAHLNLKIGSNRFDTIRTITGARTEAFRRQHTPVGAGLTGLVMRSRQPYVTPDYLHDERLEHHHTSDSSVDADGLVTMVGVPMQREDDVVGVLIASWRRPVDVPAGEVALLSSLASLAGLAVTNTWLRAETEAARTELEQAYHRIRQTNELLEWAAAADDRLTGLLHQGAPVKAVPEALHELLGADVVLVGEHDEVLGAAPEHLPPAEITTRGEGVWATDCRSGETRLATLLVRRTEQLSDIERRTVERAATTCALVLSTRNALAEAEFRSVAEAFTDLLRGSRVDIADARIRSWGLDLSAPLIVIAVRTPTTDRHTALTVARRFAQERQGLVVAFGDHVVLLVPGTDPDQPAEELVDRLRRRDLVATAGAAGCAGAPDAVRPAYQRAVRCAETLVRFGGNGVATVSSLGFVGLLLGAGQRDAVEDYVASRLGPLARNDDARSAELRQTLGSYLQHNGSLQQAAKSLRIHTNTVLQRLQRIERLLDIDLHSPGVRTEIDLAMRARALLDVVRDEEGRDP